MTKLFLSLALLVTAGVAVATEGRDNEGAGAAIRSRSELLDRELTRARRVLKGKGGDSIVTDMSMSFDMSLPPPKKVAVPKLPKKKAYDAGSKQGMAKLSKAPTPPKQAKSASKSKAPKGASGSGVMPPKPVPKSPKTDEIFGPDMSMSMTTSAPSVTVAAPTAAVQVPTAAPSAGAAIDTASPVARRRN